MTNFEAAIKLFNYSEVFHSFTIFFNREHY